MTVRITSNDLTLLANPKRAHNTGSKPADDLLLSDCWMVIRQSTRAHVPTGFETWYSTWIETNNLTFPTLHDQSENFTDIQAWEGCMFVKSKKETRPEGSCHPSHADHIQRILVNKISLDFGSRMNAKSIIPRPDLGNLILVRRRLIVKTSHLRMN